MSFCDENKNGSRQSARAKVYSNRGNLPLINLLGAGYHRVLDIGCGAGDNAALLKARQPDIKIFGITHSASEAVIALQYMENCWVSDIEGELPSVLEQKTFDVLIFSHVLEHLRDPAEVLSRFMPFLRIGGTVLIAVPNILSWRMRVQFLLGRFKYESAGVLDDTHLRFFTFFSADEYLLSKVPDLMLTNKIADGSVPLWLIRRYFFPRAWCNIIDSWGCRLWPNLFGGQILIKAIKK